MHKNRKVIPYSSASVLINSIEKDDIDTFSSELSAFDNFDFCIEFDFTSKSWDSYDFMLKFNPPLICVVCLFAARQCFDYLLSNEILLEIEDDFDRSTAFFAVAGGSIEIVRALFDHHVKFTTCDKKGDTVVHYATKYYRTDIVKYLYTIGTDLHEGNQRGATPFMWACSNGSYDIVEFLLQHGARVNEMTFGRWTPLHYAATKDTNLKIVDLLCQQKDIKIDLLNISNCTPLDIAADKGASVIVKYLLDKGAKLCEGLGKRNFINEKSHSILRALDSEEIETVKVFLEHPRSLKEITPKIMNKILDTSTGFETTEILDLIVDFINNHQELSPGSIENKIRSALMNKKLLPVITSLFNIEGIDINYQFHDLFTFLHCAIFNGDLEIVKFIISKKPNLNLKNIDGETPIIYAISRNRYEIFLYLIDLDGVDLTTTKKGKDIRTLLQNKKLWKDVLEKVKDKLPPSENEESIN